MDAVNDEIKMYKDLYPQQVARNEPTPDFDLTPIKEECETSQLEQIEVQMMKLRDQLDEATDSATNAEKGSKEAAIAWEIVEEIGA